MQMQWCSWDKELLFHSLMHSVLSSLPSAEMPSCNCCTGEQGEGEARLPTQSGWDSLKTLTMLCNLELCKFQLGMYSKSFHKREHISPRLQPQQLHESNSLPWNEMSTVNAATVAFILFQKFQSHLERGLAESTMFN